MHLLSLAARCLFILGFLLTVSPLFAGELLKEDIDKIFADIFVVGEMQSGMPLYPLFSKSADMPDAKRGVKLRN